MADSGPPDPPPALAIKIIFLDGEKHEVDEISQIKVMGFWLAGAVAAAMHCFSTSFHSFTRLFELHTWRYIIHFEYNNKKI